MGRVDGGASPKPILAGRGTYPLCGAPHEDKTHLIWDSSEWAEWLPRVLCTAEGLPQLGPADSWPVCPRRKAYCHQASP